LDDDRYRLLFERSQVPMAFGGVDGTLLAVNQAVCDFLGRPASEPVA